MKIQVGNLRGKSAYEQAVDGGYEGAEEDFNALLAQAVDETINGAEIVAGDLVVTKLDGTTQNLGRVRGLDGANVLPTSQAVAQAIVEPGPARDELRNTMADQIVAGVPAVLASEFVPTEDATAMQGRKLMTATDSFGTTVGGVQPYTDRIVADRGMTLNFHSLGGAFASDVLARAIGSGATIAPATLAPDDFGLVAFGINPAFFQDTNGPTRANEKEALELLIWLMASESRIEETAWTETGTWTTYTDVAPFLSGGSARSAEAGASATITPGAGDYIGVAYNLRAGAGADFYTGDWTVNGVNVYANTAGANRPPNTNLNVTPLVYRPVRLLGVQAGQAIGMSRSAAGAANTMRDVLLKLTATPPWIIVVKPTYTAAGSTLANETVDLYRKDIDEVVASVTAAYKPLRGRIIVVDPVTSGWDAETMTQADKLHPSNAGAEFLEDLVQRQVAYAVRLRQQMIAMGTL